MRSLLSLITVVCLFAGAARSAQIPEHRSLDTRDDGQMTDSSAIFQAIGKIDPKEHVGTPEKKDPVAPRGYKLLYGPTGGANEAPGYMGFEFLKKYDVDACARLCNTRKPDVKGGACKYFNIWEAVVSGVPKTVTCSMYYLVPKPSTAVNHGQGNLVVTDARGYAVHH